METSAIKVHLNEAGPSTELGKQTLAPFRIGPKNASGHATSKTGKRARKTRFKKYASKTPRSDAALGDTRGVLVKPGSHTKLSPKPKTPFELMEEQEALNDQKYARRDAKLARRRDRKAQSENLMSIESETPMVIGSAGLSSQRAGTGGTAEQTVTEAKARQDKKAKAKAKKRALKAVQLEQRLAENVKVHEARLAKGLRCDFKNGREFCHVFALAS